MLKERDIKLKSKNLIFGLDNKANKIKMYCTEFLKSESEFVIAKEKLSITPTFLFYGLPGTGKTTIAHEVYKELKEEFNIDLKCLRIDDLISHNFGESSKNLISFFKQIESEIKENNSYAFIIIDELDSFTVNRYQNDSESIKRVLLTFNTIIDEMFIDGGLNNIILIATTNMQESIDASVLRRFFFHEDFNITLNKKDFFEFIDEVKSVSKVFESIDLEDKEKLYETYIAKKFTLGEFKTIFAHLYMEIKSDINYEKLKLDAFFTKESFYEIITKQQNGRILENA